MQQILFSKFCGILKFVKTQLVNLKKFQLRKIWILELSHLSYHGIFVGCWRRPQLGDLPCPPVDDDQRLSTTTQSQSNGTSFLQTGHSVDVASMPQSSTVQHRDPAVTSVQHVDLTSRRVHHYTDGLLEHHRGPTAASLGHRSDVVGHVHVERRVLDWSVKDADCEAMWAGCRRCKFQRVSAIIVVTHRHRRSVTSHLSCFNDVNKKLQQNIYKF